MPCRPTITVIGFGNRLLSDDAAGPLVIDILDRDYASLKATDVVFHDGGTMGLSLLPEIEDADGFIAIDAASFGAAPGTVRVFEGAEMDALLTGVKKTAHEVALGDILSAAALNGALPPLRALVAVQPASTALGLEPTPAVAVALTVMVEATAALIARWRASDTADEQAPSAGEEVQA